MRRSVIITSSLVALALVLTAASSGAFTYGGAKWTSSPTLRVDSDGLAGVNDDDGGVTMTRNAITSSSAWNGAGAGTVIYTSSGSVSTWATCDGSPMLAFTDPDDACTGSCLAVAFTCWNSSTLAMIDGDIATNSTGHNWTSKGEDPNEFWDCTLDFQSEVYVEAVMVHEVGHVLGLGHTDVSGATMYPSVSSCNNAPASTEADDEFGLLSLYGRKLYKWSNGSTNLFTEYPGNTQYKAYARVYLGSSVTLTGASINGEGHNNDSDGYARVMRVEVNGNTYTVNSWINDGDTESFSYSIPNGVLVRGWNHIRAYIHWSNEDYDDGHWVTVNLVTSS